MQCNTADTLQARDPPAVDHDRVVAVVVPGQGPGQGDRVFVGHGVGSVQGVHVGHAVLHGVGHARKACDNSDIDQKVF